MCYTICSFEEILRALHFFDHEDPDINVNNRFHKLGSFLPTLLNNFRKMVNPGEFLTLDEQLMPYKGRLSFKQYNPKKRGRFGVKSFFLMDAEHKYVLDILPYQGKSTQMANPEWIQNFGFGGAAVLTMLEKGYFNKHHRIIVDNYFQSPKLAKFLLTKNTYVLGTVRKDRKLMPALSDPVTGRPTKLQKGEAETYSDGDILLERWNDRREVLILNTFMEHRMEECESLNPNNNRLKPATVLVYNKVMGALDDMDEVIRPYQTLRKTLKWYRKFAFHLIDIAVHNAFVLAGVKNPTIKSDGYKDFVLNLIEEIISKNSVVRSSRGRPLSIQSNTTTSNLRHFPSTIKGDNGKSKRSNCHLCWSKKTRKATKFICTTCEKWFCFSDENSCFMVFHKTLH